MLGAIAQRTVALLRPRAWRTYALVILATAVPAGALVSAAQHGWLPAYVLGAAAWLVLVTALTAATFAARWRSARPTVLARHIGTAVPRAILHATIAASPAVVTGALLVIANWIHPLLALTVVPIGFVVLAITGVAILLAIAGVVMGDRGRAPACAVALVRLQPWRLAGGLVAVGVPVLFAALPTACVGLVVMALTGPLGWIGIGMALAAPLPFYGALSVAAWRELGGGALDSAAAPAHARTPVAPTPTGSYQWQPGPEWQFVLDPAAPWGTWIELGAGADGSRAPQTIGLTVEVIGVAMPRLLTCDEAGTWLEWPVPAVSGTILPIQLPVGASYVQLISTAQVACHARLVVSSQQWVESGASAAA